MDQQLILSAFATETLLGLSSNPKYLSSKYFYDHNGSAIFEKIMRMPEYYLTDCELEIFEKQKSAICNEFNPDNRTFELIELGAGDGLKPKYCSRNCFNKSLISGISRLIFPPGRLKICKANCKMKCRL